MFHQQLDHLTTLRTLGIEDAPALFSLVDENRARLREWLPWLDFNRTPKDSETFITLMLEGQQSNQSFAAGIWHESHLVGLCSYHPIDWKNKSVSLGYWVGRNAQGKGLARKATWALTQHAFDELKLNRVEIRVAAGNIRSQVIPKSLNFKEEGILRQCEWLYDHYVDHVVFSMLASELSSVLPKIPFSNVSIDLRAKIQ